MKNKYLVIGGVSLAVVVLAGGGFWWWHSHADKKAALGAASINVGNNADQASQTSMSLSPTGPAPSDPNSLSVSSSTSATSLGQLGGNSGSGSVTGGTNNSGKSNSSPAIDPSTFAQYEKYKASNGALFGEVQPGTGTELTAGHKAAVYYKGWLTNGQMFDQSRSGSDGKLQPFVFELGAHQVIPGWEQGVSGMKVGGTRLIIVPPSVGYGSTAQASIPANSVLVFEVQLLQVE